jgi:hypothetical protein
MSERDTARYTTKRKAASAKMIGVGPFPKLIPLRLWGLPM